MTEKKSHTKKCDLKTQKKITQVSRTEKKKSVVDKNSIHSNFFVCFVSAYLETFCDHQFLLKKKIWKIAKTQKKIFLSFYICAKTKKKIFQLKMCFLATLLQNSHIVFFIPPPSILFTSFLPLVSVFFSPLFSSIWLIVKPLKNVNVVKPTIILVYQLLKNAFNSRIK